MLLIKDDLCNSLSLNWYGMGPYTMVQIYILLVPRKVLYDGYNETSCDWTSSDSAIVRWQVLEKIISSNEKLLKSIKRLSANCFPLQRTIYFRSCL